MPESLVTSVDDEDEGVERVVIHYEVNGHLTRNDGEAFK